MTLFKVVDELDKKQLLSVSKVLNLDTGPSHSKAELKIKINDRLSNFYQTKRNEEGYGAQFRIVALWRDYIYQIIKGKKVPENLKGEKKDILDELGRLYSKESLNDDDRIEDMVRDILLLLWKSSNSKEQDRFIKFVREELETQSINLADEEIKKIITNLLAGSLGSAMPFVVPLISQLVLKRLTQGFIAWILISLLGQKAFQVAALGALAGPIGWAISGGLFGAGILSSIVNYKNRKEEIEFVQAIFSIYSYRYQNRINRKS